MVVGVLARASVISLLAGAASGIGFAAMLDKPDPWLVASILGGVFAIILFPLALVGCACARRVGAEPVPVLVAVAGGRPFANPGRAAVEVIVVVAAIVAFGIVAVATMLPADVSTEGLPLDERDLLEGWTISLVASWEETVFRLAVLFALLAMLGVRFRARDSPFGARVWIALGFSAALFALIHLPEGRLLGIGDAGAVVFLLVQKGFGFGLPLAVLAWRWGLEAAFLAHFLANGVLVTMGALLG